MLLLSKRAFIVGFAMVNIHEQEKIDGDATNAEKKQQTNLLFEPN
jgi:hypothetical protein